LRESRRRGEWVLLLLLWLFKLGMFWV